LENYADDVTLAEPSQQQLDIAKKYLKDHPEVHRELMQADDLRFEDGDVELLTMVRVMHHLPDPTPEFKEIARVLSPKGYAIIEVANYLHMRNRLKHMARRERMPVKPVDIRSDANKRTSEANSTPRNYAWRRESSPASTGSRVFWSEHLFPGSQGRLIKVFV
jgi:ubiquinone/menaquinone biosynthesis C-methylase UbiE